jgi:predicted DNA-binding protein (UPF0251 family)
MEAARNIYCFNASKGVKMPRPQGKEMKYDEKEVEKIALKLSQYGEVTTQMIGSRMGISKETVAAKLRSLGWKHISTGASRNTWVKM